MFPINQDLTDFINKNLGIELLNINKISPEHRENLQKVEMAITQMADLVFNFESDNFKNGFEFCKKAKDLEVHAIEWHSDKYSGEEGFLFFIGTLDDIKTRLNQIPKYDAPNFKVENVKRKILKDICIKCRAYSQTDTSQKEGKTLEESISDLERMWELDGKILCPKAGLWGDIISKLDSPPESCPYFAEHLITSEA